MDAQSHGGRGSLKRCPFCGGPGQIESGVGNPSNWVAAVCPECKFHLPLVFTVEEAIIAWNKRAEDADAEALERQVDIESEWEEEQRNAEKGLPR